MRARTPSERYLDLLAKALLGLLTPEPRAGFPRGDGTLRIVPMTDPEPRRVGFDWPVEGHTMVGELRLANVRHCVEDVLERDVPGDLIEAGVWRGGVTIFMRGLLEAHGVHGRRVWVADSFQGLPAPAEDQPADAGSRFHLEPYLAVSEGQVRESFERFGLLDDQVRFVPGWFRETLPSLAGETFAVVRLDGDMYDSTMASLENLYPRLSVGGYLIVDDYGAVAGCRQAVTEYRKRHAIDAELHEIDWTGVFWRKEEPVPE